MKHFSGFEYLLINVANAFDKDKLTFEERISWVKENWKDLPTLAYKTEDPATSVKAVTKLLDACSTGKTDAIIYLDASCSGIQIMSSLLNCLEGARNTGLIDPDVRADLYTTGQVVMNKMLAGKVSLDIPRKFLKEAIMTSGYGSEKTPKELFEPLGVLSVFYEAMDVCAPEAFKLMPLLLRSWNPSSDKHSWVLPDGFNAIIPVTEKLEKRVEIAELGSSVTVTYEDYTYKEKGRSNVANVIHSIDAFVLRNLVRRCNYNVKDVQYVLTLIEETQPMEVLPSSDITLLTQIYWTTKHQFVDPVWFSRITAENILHIPKWILQKLYSLGTDMLKHPPFEVTTVHDAFGSHATNCNRVRYIYKEILAELSEADILDCVWEQLGQQGRIKNKPSIAHLIRQSNYAIG